MKEFSELTNIEIGLYIDFIRHRGDFIETFGHMDVEKYTMVCSLFAMMREDLMPTPRNEKLWKMIFESTENYEQEIGEERVAWLNSNE